MVPLVQFKKREKQPWRSVNFSRVAGFSLHFTKINTPLWLFLTFFKLYKWYQIVQRTTFERDSLTCHLIFYGLSFISVTNAKKRMFLFVNFSNVSWVLKLVSKNLCFVLCCIYLWMMFFFSDCFKICSIFLLAIPFCSRFHLV